MTKSWVALAVILVGCDGGTAPAPGGKGDGAAGNADGSTGGPDAGPAPVPGHITFTNTTAAGGPKLVWVAFNDGEGPWQTLDPQGNTYTFQVQGRYGLAFVCEALPDAFSGEVVHATAAELPALTVDCGPATSTTNHQLTGSISGVDPEVTVEVQAAGAGYTHRLGTVSAPRLTYEAQLPAGTYDVLALATVAGRSPRAFFRRDVELQRDTVLPFQFGLGIDTALAEQPLTLVGGAASAPMPYAAVSLFTGRGSFQATAGAGPLASYFSFPSSVLQPGDTQTFEVGSATAGVPPLSMRGVVLGFREPRPLEVKLPPPFDSARVTAAATAPTLRPRMSFQPYPGALFYQLSATQVSPSTFTSWLAIFSDAWLGGATTYELPDFSAARDFRDVYGFDPTAPLDYTCDAVTSSRDFARTINDDAATRAGARMTYARKVEHGLLR